MGFDSTADLLFRIGADSSDAEGNIQRFRALFGTNLDEMGEQFSDWATKIFGAWNTAQAAGAAAMHCADQYAHYVEEVEKGSRVTGIAIGDMSALKFSAESVGANYDALTGGLARFTSEVVKGAEGGKKQLEIFERLGVSQDQLKAGEKDMLPLLESVSEHFRNLATDQDRLTEARDLFGRNAGQFLDWLKLGKKGMADLAAEAKNLGMILSPEDVKKLHEIQAELVILNAVTEAVELEMGKAASPIKKNWGEVEAAILKTITTTKGARDVLLLALAGPFGALSGAWTRLAGQVTENVKQIQASVDATVKAREHLGNQPLIPLPPKGKKSPTEKTAEDFRGLSEVLDQVAQKMAKAVSPEAEIAQEIKHLGDEAHTAAVKLTELDKAGKIAPETAQAQATAWINTLALIPKLQDQLNADLAQKRAAEIAREMAGLNERLGRDLLERLEVKGREEKEAQEKAQREELAYQGEMARLGEQRVRIEGAYQTSEQRIAAQYTADVAKFDAAEEQKTLTAARNEQERAALAAEFAAIRAALLTKETVALQTLHNSQGWQGIFGAQFEQSIKRNEALAREWASSTNQSMMLVRVSLESLKEMGQEAFQQLEQGMGANIVHAVIYKQSIGEAMKAATEAVLEQVAQQAAVKAIESAAWGFLDLAMGDFSGAAAAFEAAALFGSVAAAGAISARAIGPSQGGASAPAAGASATSSSASASGYSGAGGSQQSPNTVVNVWGHVIGVSGIQELTAAINDAVLNKDVTLTATNTKNGVQVTR